MFRLSIKMEVGISRLGFRDYGRMDRVQFNVLVREKCNDWEGISDVNVNTRVTSAIRETCGRLLPIRTYREKKVCLCLLEHIVIMSSIYPSQSKEIIFKV